MFPRAELNDIRNKASANFDAPRPAVTNRLGKKRTDELIRADGDTWQEYLAVSEKAHTTSSNASTRGSALSFFGKKKKKKGGSNSNLNSGSTPANTNEKSSSKLILRSYYQNQRTGKKVWDEPPSGASKIVPATEEMRRMAEFQLDELYVATSPNTSVEDLANSSSSKKKKSVVGGLFRRGNNTNGNNFEAIGEKTSSGGSGTNNRRIRYKPNSNLLKMENGKSRRSGGGQLNDRQLQEAIQRSMVETYGGAAERIDTASNAEQEDEILRRVLEESRLEALSLANNTRPYDSNIEDYDLNDRKPPARKQPPTNSGMYNTYSQASVPSSTTKPRQSDRRRQSQQKESWSSTPLSSSAPRRSPGDGRNNPSRRSRSSKNNFQDDVGFV